LAAGRALQCREFGNVKTSGGGEIMICTKFLARLPRRAFGPPGADFFTNGVFARRINSSLSFIRANPAKPEERQHNNRLIL
jgi:hypothetical protein